MFTGTENHEISLEDASILTERYRNQFSSTQLFIKGEFFGKQAIQNLINEPNCVGIRIYYGLNENNIPKLVIVGVDFNENDLIQGSILDFGKLCPPACSNSNPLNS